MMTTLDWFVNVMVPTVFSKLDGWILVDGVSLLGITGAVFVIWFIYRRFT